MFYIFSIFNLQNFVLDFELMLELDCNFNSEHYFKLDFNLKLVLDYLELILELELDFNLKLVHNYFDLVLDFDYFELFLVLVLKLELELDCYFDHLNYFHQLLMLYSSFL